MPNRFKTLTYQPGVPHNDKQERFRINEELMVMIRACDLNKRPMVHGDNAAAYYQSVAADAAAAAAAVEQALVDSAVAAVQAAVARGVPAGAAPRRCSC